jgi:phosphoglycerol geranylgeranyltransferase
MKRTIYNELLEKKIAGHKSIAVLIDPDNYQNHLLKQLINLAADHNVDYFFVGGSLVSSYNFSNLIRTIKDQCRIPVILFPGSYLHICPDADAIMFLSLISGRNPELLIGQHVVAAPILKTSGLEVISTGYLLIDGGTSTTVSYMSATNPIPVDKPDIAKCTAMAGEMLGLKMIYLDAGSGALQPVPLEMIRSVADTIEVPLIVGGGLNSPRKIWDALSAGADLVVVGNGIEKNPNLMVEVSIFFNNYNKSLNIDQ